VSASHSLANLGVLNTWDNVAASTTDEVLVTAITGKKIRVLGVVINQGDTTPSTVVFNSKGGGAGTAISPTLKAAANGGFVMPFAREGYFETNSGEGLSVSTGSGSTTGLVVLYDRVPVPR
jgi:hypothetical protein